jgi:hypothetical protein
MTLPLPAAVSSFNLRALLSWQKGRQTGSDEMMMFAARGACGFGESAVGCELGLRARSADVINCR